MDSFARRYDFDQINERRGTDSIKWGSYPDDVLPIMDFDAFEQSITDRTRLFLLCNPHNPTGRVFSRIELERLAEICLRHKVIICSDEIHKDFVYEGHRHLPIASLDSEIASQTITLLAPSKTYNIAGLQCAVALAGNAELRDRLEAVSAGFLDVPVNLFGYVAALAAYKEGEDWLRQVLAYLQSNRDFVTRYVRERLPGIEMVEPQATYLAWLDCRKAGIGGDPVKSFLRRPRWPYRMDGSLEREGKDSSASTSVVPECFSRKD